MRLWQLSIVGLLGAACSSAPAPKTAASSQNQRVRYNGGDAPLSRAADASMRLIPAGHYIAGSTKEERAAAYDDYNRTSGNDAARRNKWFDAEQWRQRRKLPAYKIDLSPVTNAAYAEFVADTKREPPRIDAKTWKAQGFNQPYETEVKRFNWSDDGPPPGRADHPVLLVTWQDAQDYCTWRGNVVASKRQLPTAAQYEKASRGEHGLNYPWGNDWDKSKLHSGLSAPDDTVSVGGFPQGASPYGVLGLAGNVFQWTATPWRGRKDRMTVKGSAWEDHAGLGRGASQHGRKVTIRHAIVGFRCAGVVPVAD